MSVHDDDEPGYPGQEYGEDPPSGEQDDNPLTPSEQDVAEGIND